MKATAEIPVKIEVKNIKHVFTTEERNSIGGDLARTFGDLRGVEGEFDQIKASYKAKITEKEARIDNLSTAIVNGFDMRDVRCRVRFDVAKKEKSYYVEAFATDMEGREITDPVLVEPMTLNDFQTELLQAESIFDAREEIQLFKPAEGDAGTLIVGRLAGKWFSALRVRIGKLELNERLDAEQKCVKERPAAVAMAVKRFQDWSKTNLKDLAAGFQESAKAVAEAHKERAE